MTLQAAVNRHFVVLLLLGHGVAANEQCFCALSGIVDDCCCSIEDVNKLNDQLHPLVQRLTESKFFKYYRANMDRPCQFWRQHDALCSTNSCGLESCSEVGYNYSLMVMPS